MSGKKMGRPVVMPDGENIIARLRRARGWSQAETATALGIRSREHVSMMERGVRAIPGPVQKLVDMLLREGG